jgi:hypothetical protein
MFPEGSKDPYERMRVIIQRLAEPLKSTPYRVSITGHTAATRETPESVHGKWGLSTDRANAVRQILEAEGYPSANFYKVAGKADTDPLFPEDPSMAPNRRVTITLVREASPVPRICSLKLPCYRVSRSQKSLRQHTTFPTTSSSLSGTSSLPCLGLSEMILTCACFAGRNTCSRLITMPANASRMA